jgi:hypothetical protein
MLYKTTITKLSKEDDMKSSIGSSVESEKVKKTPKKLLKQKTIEEKAID